MLRLPPRPRAQVVLRFYERQPAAAVPPGDDTRLVETPATPPSTVSSTLPSTTALGGGDGDTSGLTLNHPEVGGDASAGTLCVPDP